MIGIECGIEVTGNGVRNWERATLRGRYKTESGRQPSTQLIILISSSNSSSTRQRQFNSTRGGNSGTCGILLLRLHCTQKSIGVVVASALPMHKQQQQTASNKLRLFCKTKLWLLFGCCFSFFFWFSNLNLKLNVLLSSSTPPLFLQHKNTLCQVAQQRRVKFDWTKYAMRHVVCSPVCFFQLSVCTAVCVRYLA